MGSASIALATGQIPVAAPWDEAVQSLFPSQAQADPVAVTIDPMPALTVALRIIEKGLDLGIRIYDVTPQDLKVQGAADWARFGHNVIQAVLDLQDDFRNLTRPKRV